MGIVPKVVSTFAAYEAEFGIKEKIRHLVELGERGELVPNKPYDLGFAKIVFATLSPEGQEDTVDMFLNICGGAYASKPSLETEELRAAMAARGAKMDGPYVVLMYAPVVKRGKRFAAVIGHELGHIAMGHLDDLDDLSGEERAEIALNPYHPREREADTFGSCVAEIDALVDFLEFAKKANARAIKAGIPKEASSQTLACVFGINVRRGHLLDLKKIF